MKARKYFRGRREAIVGVKMRQTEVGREERQRRIWAWRLRHGRVEIASAVTDALEEYFLFFNELAFKVEYRSKKYCGKVG